LMTGVIPARLVGQFAMTPELKLKVQKRIISQKVYLRLTDEALALFQGPEIKEELQSRAMVEQEEVHTVLMTPVMDSDSYMGTDPEKGAFQALAVGPTLTLVQAQAEKKTREEIRAAQVVLTSEVKKEYFPVSPIQCPPGSVLVHLKDAEGNQMLRMTSGIVYTSPMHTSMSIGSYFFRVQMKVLNHWNRPAFQLLSAHFFRLHYLMERVFFLCFKCLFRFSIIFIRNF